MIEGDKSFVYKINSENIANKTEVKQVKEAKNIEIISGLSEGDIVNFRVKESGLGKIKPINE